jgi:ribosomal protein L21
MCRTHATESKVIKLKFERKGEKIREKGKRQNSKKVKK